MGMKKIRGDEIVGVIIHGNITRKLPVSGNGGRREILGKGGRRVNMVQ
jgi:hypothetical protein